MMISTYTRYNVNIITIILNVFELQLFNMFSINMIKIGSIFILITVIIMSDIWCSMQI